MSAGALLLAWLAVAPGDNFRPDERVLGFHPEALFGRFVPAVTGREALRARIWSQWTRDWKREADALMKRFRTEDDWRPAFADAAALVERFLVATDLPRKGEWYADGQGCPSVEVLEHGPGGVPRKKVELRCRSSALPILLAPQDEDPASTLEDAADAMPKRPARSPRDQPKPPR